MQRVDFGSIDVGDLYALMPLGTHLAFLRFGSPDDFCLAVRIEHEVAGERLDDIKLKKCWKAGEFHVVFKLEQSSNEGFQHLTFGLNDLGGGGTASGTEIPIASVFGTGQDVTASFELNDEPTQIIFWRITDRDGDQVIAHELRFFASLTETLTGLKGTEPG